jgi:hypothetical protein
LERKGPERDWGQLVRTLKDLVLRSGRSLVRKATERGIQRTANQLLGVIKEEQDALERPLVESEQRIARLRKTLGESEVQIRDLGVLLTAEQQRLSGIFAERRNLFLKQAQIKARAELKEHLSLLARSRYGPADRRNVHHLAQEVARAQLTPWLLGEAIFAEEEFRKIAKRFVELANEYLRRLGETDLPGLAEPPEDFSPHQKQNARSHFYFNVIEQVAAPASPLLFILDLLRGGLGLRRAIVRDAQEFLDQLLEVNSSRVQSDVDERVRENRKKLESEIRGVIRQGSEVADRALAHAQAAMAAGAPAVEAALERLRATEREVLDIAGRFAPA